MTIAIESRDWSDTVKAKTREILVQLPVVPFLMIGGSCMKNLDTRYGFITFEDALAANYTITLHDNSISFTYSSIEELIDDGWVAD